MLQLFFFLFRQREEQLALDAVSADEMQPEYRLVKAADKLSAYLKCLEEQKAGNTEFDSAAKQTWDAMKAMNRPELDWFLNFCLGAFKLNLDQL